MYVVINFLANLCWKIDIDVPVEGKEMALRGIIQNFVDTIFRKHHYYHLAMKVLITSHCLMKRSTWLDNWIEFLIDEDFIV